MTTALRQSEPETSPEVMSQLPAQTDESPIGTGESPADAGIQAAFRTYLEAREHMAGAFKLRERRDSAAYEDAQRRFRIYEEDMDRAISDREEAERAALGLYWETIDRAVQKAHQVYRDRMKLALKDCRQAVEQAWKSSMETSASAAGVFYTDDGIRYGRSDSSKVWGLNTVRQSLARLKRPCLSLLRQGGRLLRRMGIRTAPKAAT